MKIVREETPFTPITITIETPQELNILKHVCGFNKTVAKAIPTNNNEESERIATLLGKLYNSLHTYS